MDTLVKELRLKCEDECSYQQRRRRYDKTRADLGALQDLAKAEPRPTIALPEAKDNSTPEASQTSVSESVEHEQLDTASSRHTREGSEPETQTAKEPSHSESASSSHSEETHASPYTRRRVKVEHVESALGKRQGVYSDGQYGFRSKVHVLGTTDLFTWEPLDELKTTTGRSDTTIREALEEYSRMHPRPSVDTSMIREALDEYRQIRERERDAYSSYPVSDGSNIANLVRGGN
jgi:hypothetical protein